MLEIDRQKAEARIRAKALRAGCDPALGVGLAALALRDCPPPPGAIIGGVHPLPWEIDTMPLLAALAARRYTISLPETPEPGQPLRFRRWQPGDKLVPGRFGTSHPESEILQPDFIMVPLLAFDKTGRRLGHGGGYYDRTLAALPAAFRLGCGFAAQELNEVPAGPYDVRLHAVATEHGVTRF